MTELDSEGVPMSILAELGGQGVLPSALNRQPEIDGQRLQAKNPFPIATARVPNDPGCDFDAV